MNSSEATSPVLTLLGIAAVVGVVMAGVGVAGVLTSELGPIDAVTEPVSWAGGIAPHWLIGCGAVVVGLACFGWAIRTIFVVRLPVWIRIPLLILSIGVSNGAAVAVMLLACWIAGVPTSALSG